MLASRGEKEERRWREVEVKHVFMPLVLLCISPHPRQRWSVEFHRRILVHQGEATSALPQSICLRRPTMLRACPALILNIGFKVE